MSKLFYDRLLTLKEIDKIIKKTAKNPQEREELWALVDEIIHHRVMGCIMDNLPREHHEEFLELFYRSPHDEDLLFGYLKGKTNKDIEKELKQELENISSDILEEIKSSKK